MTAKPQQTIIQIVPFRSANPDGIGDYAVQLAARLRADYDLNTQFIGCNPNEAQPANDGWPTTTLESRSPAELFDTLERQSRSSPSAALLLHVAGYGYEKRGAPFWLLNGLRRWRRHAPRQQLLCIFHELYAAGPIWNSSFWLSAVQKHVTRELWKISDTGITTNSTYQRELASWRPNDTGRLHLMPVPSNVGEPAGITPFEQRPHRAAVFGRAGVEHIVYGVEAATFAQSIEDLGIGEIVDMGSRQGEVPSAIGGAPVKALGRLPARDISRELLNCRFGFSSYDIARLGRSTIFAAYAAHGVIPVCHGSSGARPGEGLAMNHHFLQLPAVTPAAAELNAMQSALVSWYGAHNLDTLASLTAGLCGGARANA